MERKIIQLFSQNAQGFEYDCVKYAMSKPEIQSNIVYRIDIDKKKHS